MKMTVLKKFADKHTGTIHKPGDILEVTEKRLAEIQSVNASLVKVVQEEAAAETEADEEAPLENMTVTQLKALAKQMGLTVAKKAKKADIIAAIEEATE